MDTVLRAWFVAVATWTAIPVGCLALLVVNHLLGREVFLPRVLEAGCRMLWPAAAAFLPVLLWPSAVFPWMEPGFTSHGPLQAAWLDPAGFALRTAIYFAAWIAAAAVLIREDRVLHAGGKRRGVAVVAGIVWLATASFAGVDWVMSLDPAFSSSSFGLMIAAHQMAAGLAFAVLADSLLLRDPAPQAVARGLLVGGALVWAFFAYMEFLTVWSGNVPALQDWYVERAGGAWPSLRALAAGLLALGVAAALAVPLGPGGSGLLLLRCGAALILLSQFVEAVWLLLPAMAPDGGAALLLHAMAQLIVGGVFLAVFQAALARRRAASRSGA